MSRLLTLSKAARLLGIARGLLQQEIRDGRIETFEGKVLLDELQRAYPDVQVESSAMLERMEQIKEQALYKDKEQPIDDVEQLHLHLMRLQRDLGTMQRELYWYAEMLDELMEKLSRVQQGCNHEQQIHIAALKTWLCQKIDVA